MLLITRATQLRIISFCGGCFLTLIWTKLIDHASIPSHYHLHENNRNVMLSDFMKPPPGVLIGKGVKRAVNVDDDDDSINNNNNGNIIIEKPIISSDKTIRGGGSTGTGKTEDNNNNNNKNNKKKTSSYSLSSVSTIKHPKNQKQKQPFYFDSQWDDTKRIKKLEKKIKKIQSYTTHRINNRIHIVYIPPPKSHEIAKQKEQDEILMLKLNETYNFNYTDIQPKSKYAYAFLVGSVDPDHSPGYKGFIYDIIVSTRILRESNSTADVVVLIQMSSKSKQNKLPDSDSRVLHGMGIRVIYIPKESNNDNENNGYDSSTFYDTVMEKFRILQLIEYDRVLFLDADVMPFHSFDYIFDASVKGQIGNNLLYSTQGEPCNAGFFMLTPGVGKYEKIQEIIDRREISVINRNGRAFDEELGWGINMIDNWNGTKRGGNTWRFWYSAADQGLLYYWTKYIEQNVTQILGGKFVTFGSIGEQYPVIVKTEYDIFEHHKGPAIEQHNWPCSKEKYVGTINASDYCHEPVRNFAHFWGNKKPWLRGEQARIFRKKPYFNRYSLFFYHLDKINNEYNMKLNMDDWNDEKEKMHLDILPLGTANDMKHFWKSLYNRINKRRRLYLEQKAKEWNITISEPEY